MSTLYKEYIKMPENARSEVAGKEIKMYITFNRETHSWFSRGPIPIGYRVCVVPVVRTDCGNGMTMEESGALTGFNDTLLEVNRQSKKRLEQAITILQERKDRYLQWFVKTEEVI